MANTAQLAKRQAAIENFYQTSFNITNFIELNNTNELCALILALAAARNITLNESAVVEYEPATTYNSTEEYLTDYLASFASEDHRKFMEVFTACFDTVNIKY